MATYKVLQDIEAEDKFIGPLTLKQFILAIVSLATSYLCFFLLTRGVWVLTFPLAPVIIVSGFLAFPWGRDQPTEVWLLAKLRFMFKPRKRIWDQTGAIELVKITAPPAREPEHFGDDLSQTEVKSRLKALATTIDSRGWVVKGVDPSTSSMQVGQSDDRLLGASSLPSTQTIADDEVIDMFDNSRAGEIQTQLDDNNNQHRQELVDMMQNQPAQDSIPANNLWFMNNQKQDGNGLSNFGTSTVNNHPANDYALPENMRRQQAPDSNDLETSEMLKRKRNLHSNSFKNHKNIDPDAYKNPVISAPSTMTSTPDPATIELARNNDRSVESLAREANQLHQQADDGEVIISLH